MAEEEFYDGLDSFEEEMFQTALVRGEKQPAFGTSQLVVPPPPLPDSQEDTFVSAHDDDESAPHEPSAATSPPPTTVAAEGGAAQAGAAAGVDVAGGGAVRAGAAAGGGAVQVGAAAGGAAAGRGAAQAGAAAGFAAAGAGAAHAVASAGVAVAGGGAARAGAAAGVAVAGGGAARAGAAAGVDVAGGGAVQHQPGMAQLGGISRPTSPGASPTSPGASPPASPSVPPKRLRASGGLKGNKRQQGGAFMAEVTGNATGHRPILTAAEVALHDKLASEYGESNHAAIAAAFTHEANLVAADMTRLLWPKFERHIKLFQRERDEQHQLKRQGLTRSVFSLIKVTVSWKLTRNHSKVLKLS
jgi:hypothetical protein